MQTFYKFAPKRPLQALLSIGLALSLTIPVQASPLSDEIDSLISADLFVHQSDIQTKAAGLNSTERELLYQRHEKNALTGSLLNLLPIFGYGSYQQGDVVGGISLSVLDGIGYALLASALIYSATSTNKSGYDFGGVLLGGLSLGSFSIGRVVGVVSPQVHGGLYNTTLQQSLNASAAPLSLTPEGLNSSPLLAFEHRF